MIDMKDIPYADDEKLGIWIERFLAETSADVLHVKELVMMAYLDGLTRGYADGYSRGSEYDGSMLFRSDY